MDSTIGTLSELRSAIAEHEARYAELALAATRLDTSGDWALDGSLSMTAWLRTHTRMLDTDTQGLLRHGRFLSRYQPFADAIASGRLSHGQTIAMRQAVKRATEPVLDDQAAAMVDILEPLTIRDTVIACRTWKARAEAVIDSPPPVVAPAELSFVIDEQGQATGKFTLSPGGTLDFETAIALALTYGGPDDNRPLAERRANALEDMCAFFNANHDRSGTPRHRPHVELVKEDGQPVRSIDGRILDPTCANTLLCDCTLHRVLKAGSTILDYGRAVRSVPYPTFRALAIRDGGCRYPGCDRPVAWTDAHHIEHWEHGGPTNLHNLCLLCRRHHRTVHQRGWTLTMDPHGTITITTPDGTTHTSRPRGSPPHLTLVE